MIELPTQQLEDLQTAVDEALWHYTPVRGALWELRAVVAPEGEVEIRGHVRASTIKDGVIGALRAVPGVLRIVDRLIADPELEMAVARALAEIKQLQPGTIAVRSHLGKVSLLGRLSDEALRKQVRDAAAAVHGVRGIDDRTH